jgi:hypothetical protein
MRTVTETLSGLLGLFLKFFSFEDTPDTYMEIGARHTVEREVIPFARTDVPNLGPDHAELVKKAEVLFKDDVNRYKWLMAIHKLRSTDTGWIIEKSNASKPFTKWGLQASA